VNCDLTNNNNSKIIKFRTVSVNVLSSVTKMLHILKLSGHFYISVHRLLCQLNAVKQNTHPHTRTNNRYFKQSVFKVTNSIFQ
jgi:hypothetical protein